MYDNIIHCETLCKGFDRTLALNNLSLQVGRGKIVGLLGPNGAGKTTLLKILAGLLTPTSGHAIVAGLPIGTETKAHVSYLPDKMYFADWMKGWDLLHFFQDFYQDFSQEKAVKMCDSLSLDLSQKVKAMSKGTKEKLQLILAMSRKAELYLLDEPIAGVDPAARDFILSTILTNYNPQGTVVISTHLISDVEQVLDEVVLIQNGQIVRHDTVDNIREQEGKSVDQYFRDTFRGGDINAW